MTTIVDNTDNNKDVNINTNSNENIKKHRRSKEELYTEERKMIIENINVLIGLNKNKYSVIYADLTENEELKNYLITNLDLIKKYYMCGTWSYFVSHLHKYEKNEVSLMKSIYKSDGFIITSKSKTLVKNNIKKNYTELYFIKPIHYI